MSKVFSLRYAALILIAAMIPSVAARAQSAFDDPGSRNAATGKGGDFKPVSDKLDAGEVTLGAATQVVVLFRNDDSKPVTTGVINLYPSSNITANIGENQCSAAPIQPGEICAISVQVKGLQAGTYRIEMLMRHDGRAKLLTTTINGTISSGDNKSVDLAGDLEIIPSSLDFGDLDHSRSQARAVILRNKTSKSISISDIHIEAGGQSGYTVNSNCNELATGAACVASVTWEPRQKGPSTGTLIVNHTGATGISTIDLTGSYDPEKSEKADIYPDAVPGKGLLVSSQETVDFGTGVEQSSSITVSLVNVGDVPLTLTGIRMTNPENGVRTEKTGCKVGSVLAPLEACPLTMTWDPVREGIIVDDIQVTHSGARGVLVMPLRGTASKAINKDKKAIMLSGAPGGAEDILAKIQPLSLNDIEDSGEEVEESGQKASVPKTGASKSAVKASDQTPSAKTAGNNAKESSSATSIEREGSLRKASSAPSAAEQGIAQVDVRGVLDGYLITSFSTNRAIVSGPGGSRVVFNGEQTVIGGVLWEIKMRPSAIEFRNGEQKVLLLFDRSLSSVNVLDTQSSSGSTTSSSTSSGPPTSSSSSTTSSSSGTQ